MPKGRSKGFGHYMCKKFFHPGNPENLERVYVAREKEKAKKKAEMDKLAEYEREQELWNNRAALTKERDREKLSLSFMYNPPAGLKDQDKSEEKQDNFKFEWQRNAPRESHIKDDPNIVDHPFGINVQFVKCMRCQVWGHQHTDKHCPKFGKSRDATQETANVLDEKKLIQDMKTTDRLQFTSFGSWDNGKVGKHYDLVYAEDEGGGGRSDLLSDLLEGIRGKEKKIKELREKVKRESRRSKKSASDGRTKKTSKKSAKSDKSRTKKSERSQPKSDGKRKRGDKRRESSRNGPSSQEISEESRVDYLNKIDDILFSDIGPPPPSKSSQSSSKRSSSPSSGRPSSAASVSSTSSSATSSSRPESPALQVGGTSASVSKLNKSDEGFLSEVDKILGMKGHQSGTNSDESSDDEDEDDTEDEDDEEDEDDNSDDSCSDEEELTEREMRLLNLINANKIDVKANFPDEYKDINCHFCRTKENSEHLSSCPVYEGIMSGTEFTDIQSRDISVVKEALNNIRQALIKRSKALSVTSVGPVTIANMELLDMPKKTELKDSSKKAIEILNSQKFKIL